MLFRSIGLNMFSLISLSDCMEAFKFENCTIFGRPLFFLKGGQQRPVPTISFHENLIISPDNPLRF